MDIFISFLYQILLEETGFSNSRTNQCWKGEHIQTLQACFEFVPPKNPESELPKLT